MPMPGGLAPAGPIAVGRRRPGRPALGAAGADGNRYGDAAVYIEHRQSEPKGGRILYAWFGLLRSLVADELLAGLLAFAGGQVESQ